MKAQSVLIGAAALLGGYLVYNTYEKGQQKAALNTWIDSTTDTQADKDQFKAVLTEMSDSELDATYNMVFNYLQKNIIVPVGSALQSQLLAISQKYHIFT